jgi:hypothetical protein
MPPRPTVTDRRSYDTSRLEPDVEIDTRSVRVYPLRQKGEGKNGKSILREVSGIERDEEPQGDNHEEWKACYPRCLPHLLYQDVQNRQGLDVTAAISDWGTRANLGPLSFHLSHTPGSLVQPRMHEQVGADRNNDLPDPWWLSSARSAVTQIDIHR